jgi:hypothetical protein
VGIALAVTLVAVIAGVFYLSRGPREVTADQAVEAFRSQATQQGQEQPKQQNESAPSDKAAAPAPAAQPQQKQQAAATPGYGPVVEGVYVFATKGYEQTDALAGQRHDYPSETSITIRKTDCGWLARWEPLRERWEETGMCERAAGTEMARYTMYHEFFRRGVTEDFACPGAYVQKPAANPGDVWTIACESKSSKVAGKVTVVGVESMNIGGQTIQATRYRYDIKVSGANEGTMVQERWLGNSPRVMARLTQVADLKVSSPFGKVGYKENYRIDLKSVRPRT